RPRRRCARRDTAPGARAHTARLHGALDSARDGRHLSLRRRLWRGGGRRRAPAPTRALAARVPEPERRPARSVARARRRRGEARRRLGGTIVTERADGFLVEAGPDSFLSEKPWALALCRRLGVEDRLVRTDDRFRKVFVWFRGRLHPLPDGFQLLAPTRLAPFATSSLFSWRGKARMALDLVLPRGGGALGGGDDE